MTNIKHALAIVLAAGSSLAAGCAEDASAESVLAVTAVESTSGHTTYKFEMPDEVPPGPTRITLDNEGSEPHHAQLFRLDDDATIDDLTEALASGGPAATTEIGAFVGGTGLVDPGVTSQADAVVDLEPGTYAFICFVEDADGTPHLAHGMLRSLEVTAGGEDVGRDDAPEPDAEITMLDYAFDAPGELAGDSVLSITNDPSSTEPHELLVARLDDGATVDDVHAAVDDKSPLPVTAVGGMQALPPGSSALLRLALRPGRYVFLCEIPSPDGHAHASKGMIAAVTIT